MQEDELEILEIPETILQQAMTGIILTQENNLQFKPIDMKAEEREAEKDLQQLQIISAGLKRPEQTKILKVLNQKLEHLENKIQQNRGRINAFKYLRDQATSKRV